MTDAELAVLSLVVEQPRHGYEIEQVIAERGMREWTGIGFSSIYYLLGKMERRGWLESETLVEAGKGPARKTYRPTAQGFALCEEAVLSRLSTPRGASPFLLGLANIVGLPHSEALEALEQYRSALQEALSRVSERRAAAPQPLPAFVDDVFDYSVATLAAESDWVSRLIGRMGSESEEGAEMPRTIKGTEPAIVEMPAQMMATVRGVGEPSEVAQKVMPALYGAAYGLKFQRKKEGGGDFKIGAPRARWLGGPNWQSIPREQWESVWGIPVPEDASELPQKVPDAPATAETWDYGTVAQIMHVGSYADEAPTIERLHAFIDEQGYEIAGPHEEEYLSRPEAKNPKTVIRYQVRKKS